MAELESQVRELHTELLKAQAALASREKEIKQRDKAAAEAEARKVSVCWLSC